MSPRTKLVHLGQYPAALLTVGVVVGQRTRLGAHLLASAQTNGVYEGLADGVRCGRTIRHQLGQRLLGSWVGSEVQPGIRQSYDQL